MKEKFLICEVCGNLIGRIHDSGVEMMCCGVPMEELAANSTDAAQEKHVPVATRYGAVVQVKVGGAEHPMTEEHNISWVYLDTKRGGQRKRLEPGEKPELSFTLSEDEALAIYAYCNLHGLWKATL